MRYIFENKMNKQLNLPLNVIAHVCFEGMGQGTFLAEFGVELHKRPVGPLLFTKISDRNFINLRHT